MTEQKANIDTRNLQHVPASVGKPSHYHSFPLQIGDMEGSISRDTVLAIQTHSRQHANQKDSTGFVVVTDSHLGRWKFLIRDTHQTQTFFGITYRCKTEEQAITFGTQALRSILDIILS